MSEQKIAVIDVFCGAGGLSLGLQNEGLDVVLGIDADEDCLFPFRTNIKAGFLQRDVAKVKGRHLLKKFADADVKVLVGCAPCQPFSLHTQKGKGKDQRWKLLDEFSRLIRETEPDIVSMENVPQMEKFHGGAIFKKFKADLEAQGFTVKWRTVFCPEYGLPQRRRRLVLLASKLGEIDLIPPTHSEDQFVTVEDAIKKLPRLFNGKTNSKDRLHHAAGLSELNRKRIKASKPAGSWTSWPKELLPECFTKESGKSYGSVYGRMSWGEPAPTITTQFYGYGTGRFGHPTQTRALSLREGAILQSFPDDYKFCPDDAPISVRRIGKLIGNAVPVKLGEVIGKSIKSHLTEVAVST